MIPLLCLGLVLQVLACELLLSWLMMPLCPSERVGFEEFDLLDQADFESVRAAEDLRG